MNLINRPLCMGISKNKISAVLRISEIVYLAIFFYRKE